VALPAPGELRSPESSAADPGGRAWHTSCTASLMEMMLSLFRALFRSHTYDLRENAHLRLGLVWGFVMGLLTVGLAFAATRIGAEKDGSGLPLAFAAALFLAPPVLCGLLSGALGTVWNDWTSPGKSSGADSRLIETGTGLYTPEYMMHQIRHALSRVARTRKTVTLLILECQESVDEVPLRLLAKVVEPLVRVGDILGRIGPGRLLLLVQGDLPCAFCVIQRMGRAFHQDTHLSLRAGVARWPQDGLFPTDLLTAADLVLKASWTAIHAPGCAAGMPAFSSSSQAFR